MIDAVRYLIVFLLFTYHREYLYIYLRDQPIWHTLRFWNAAFFDSLQSERSNKPVPPTNVPQSRSTSSFKLNLDEGALKSNVEKCRNNSLPISDNDYSLSSSSSSTSTVDSSEEISSRSLGLSLNREKKKRRASNNMSEILEDKKFQQNITFGQLGSFTCNMHAFGLTRNLCNEFLRKQCTIANLSRGK